MTTIDKKNKNKKSFMRRVFKIFLVTVMVVAAISFGGVLAVLLSVDKEFPNINKKTPRPVGLTSKVYSWDNKLIASLHGEENREFVPLNKIPKNLQNSVIAIEDERFYKHAGVDYEGIIRALVEDIKQRKIVEGGSTITQQFVKNRYLTSEKTFKRKIREAILSWQLEKKLSKKEILEAYLNTIYFGEGTYGVQTAAKRYFNKPINKLTLSESATLAGLIRAPANYSPYRNLEVATSRRNLVIRSMRKQKMISRIQEIATKSEPLIIAPKPKSEYKFAPHFIDYIKSELIAKYGANMVFKGGLKVYTTIDPDMQGYAEDAVNSTLNRPKDPSASMVAIDPKTGYIKAMVGGKDYEASKFNLAAQGHRQAGSAFKIFVLTAAVEDGYGLNDSFNSAPQSLDIKGSIRNWNVKNYGNKYRGRISLREATQWSDNSVYAQLIMRVTPARVVDMPHRLGIVSDVPAIPAIALGGLTTGVSSLEMSSAAATLSNDGIYNKPVAVYKVTDSKGNVIEKAKPTGKKAVEKSVARTVTNALTEVILKGTGTKAKLGRPAAGKTGTAQDYHDAWFVGYTPNLAAGVWMGYPNAQIQMTNVHGQRVAGGTFPAIIWQKFMSKATQKLAAENFPGAPKIKNKPDKKISNYSQRRKIYKKSEPLTKPKTYKDYSKKPVEPKPKVEPKPIPKEPPEKPKITKPKKPIVKPNKPNKPKKPVKPKKKKQPKPKKAPTEKKTKRNL